MFFFLIKIMKVVGWLIFSFESQRIEQYWVIRRSEVELRSRVQTNRVYISLYDVEPRTLCGEKIRLFWYYFFDF
jgi:hypothetical protein